MRSRPAPGFTVVEAIIAIALLGVAAASLASAMAASATLRARAEARFGAAAGTADRVAQLGRRPCAAADTAGSDRRRRTTERWAAARVQQGWAAAETVFVARIAEPTIVHMLVACAP